MEFAGTLDASSQDQGRFFIFNKTGTLAPGSNLHFQTSVWQTGCLRTAGTLLWYPSGPPPITELTSTKFQVLDEELKLNAKVLRRGQGSSPDARTHRAGNCASARRHHLVSERARHFERYFQQLRYRHYHEYSFEFPGDQCWQQYQRALLRRYRIHRFRGCVVLKLGTNHRYLRPLGLFARHSKHGL